MNNNKTYYIELRFINKKLVKLKNSQCSRNWPVCGIKVRIGTRAPENEYILFNKLCSLVPKFKIT